MDGQQDPRSPQASQPGSAHPGLVREVMDPFRRFHLGRLTLVTSGLLAVATGAIMIGAHSFPRHQAPAIVIAPEQTTVIAFRPAEVITPSFEAPAAAPAPANADYAFVVDAGGRRFALLRSIDDTGANTDSNADANTNADADADVPRSYRGIQLLGNPNYPDGAVIPVDQDQLPADLQAWRGRELTVANTCTTHVDNIVHVTLLTGTPDYFTGGEVDDSPHGLIDYATAGGHHYYAADVSSCATGDWARMSDLPTASTPVDLGEASAPLRAKARAMLFQSDASRAVQGRWNELERTGTWYQDRSDDLLSIEFRYVLHPQTGQRWLVVHAIGEYECGGLMANLLGVFRVSSDGRIQDGSVREIEPTSIKELIDVDGDGRFEVRGQTWLSGPILIDGTGGVLDKAEIPFYGCPC